MKSWVLENAAEVIKIRQAQYGPPVTNMENIARGWSVILGVEVTADQVALAMVWMKVVRELNEHKADNLVDIAGYAAVLGSLHHEDGSS